MRDKYAPFAGINLSCNKNQSCPDSPRHSSGRLSPTSDFVEDSSISEDNNSSINSSTGDQTAYGGYYSPSTAMPQNLSTKNRTTSPPKSPIIHQQYTISPTPSTSSSLSSYSSASCSSTAAAVSPSGLVLNTPHYNHKKYLREEYTRQQIKQEEEEPRNFASPVNYRYSPNQLN